MHHQHLVSLITNIHPYNENGFHWIMTYPLQFRSYLTTYCPNIPWILFCHTYLWPCWCKYGNLIWVIFRIFFLHWGWEEQLDFKFTDLLLGDRYKILWIKVSQWDVCIQPGVLVKGVEGIQENSHGCPFNTLPDGVSTLLWLWDLCDPVILS